MTIIFRNQKTSIKYQFDNIYYQPKKCQSCNTQMLARTSHCQQCNTCFQKRDHHCIWINGCIHYSNQKYFTMFLLATSVGGVCKAVIDYQFLDYVMHFTTNNLLSYIKCKELASFNIFRTIQWNLLHFPISSMSFIMHTMIAIMVGLLGLIHVKQVYDNQTSLEKRKNSAIKADLINKYALFVKDQNGNIFILNSENNAQFRNSKYIALKKQESLKLLQTYKPFKK
ncbi:Palmitoyltransferase [Spironucleus salmonicida]|nr:Palmitoyltransferase [Spironucleus salmonicida]